MLPQHPPRIDALTLIVWRHWLRSWWPWHWRPHHTTTVYWYEECPCGFRRYRRVGSGYQPLDREWLRGGRR